MYFSEVYIPTGVAPWEVQPLGYAKAPWYDSDFSRTRFNCLPDRSLKPSTSFDITPYLLDSINYCLFSIVFDNTLGHKLLSSLMQLNLYRGRF